MSISFKRCKYNKVLYDVYRNNAKFRCECNGVLRSSIFDKNDKKYVIIELPEDFCKEVCNLEHELESWCNKSIQQPFDKTICAKVPSRYGRVEVPIIDSKNKIQNSHNLHKGMIVLIDISVSKAWVSTSACGIYWTISKIKTKDVLVESTL